MKLIDSKGKPFLKKYHPLADLAPRDVVARAIDREMKRSGSPFVRLDTPNMKGDFTDRFPNVYENCLKRWGRCGERSDPSGSSRSLFMRWNSYGDSIVPQKLKGLYACGEVACTRASRSQPSG